MLLWSSQRHHRRSAEELGSLNSWQLVDKLHMQGKQGGHSEGINPRGWWSGSGLRLGRIPCQQPYCCFIVLFDVWQWVISPQKFMMVDCFHHNMLMRVSLIKVLSSFLCVGPQNDYSLTFFTYGMVDLNSFFLLQSPQKIICGKWKWINR